MLSKYTSKYQRLRAYSHFGLATAITLLAWKFTNVEGLVFLYPILLEAYDILKTGKKPTKAKIHDGITDALEHWAGIIFTLSIIN